MEIEGTRQSGCSRKIWWHCVKDNRKSSGLSHEDD